MNKLILGFALGVLSFSTQATMYIFTPNKPVKVIERNGNDYTVVDMGSGDITQVLDMGGVTAITGGGRPTSFIMDGGEIGRTMGNEVIPALDPNTGTVAPVIEMPRGLDVNYPDWQ